MTINVTQRHIDEGSRYHCNSCPVARAISKQLPLQMPYIWRVAGGCAIIDDLLSIRTLAIMPLPEEATDFIEYFDRFGRSAVAPFSFELAAQQ